MAKYVIIVLLNSYLEGQITRDERQLHEPSDVLQQRSAVVNLSLGRSYGGMGPNIWQKITNILAICMVNWIKIPRVDAVQYCPNIENFVRSLMFFRHWTYASEQ